ncbi:MAG: PKD domain-containing protein [bacterium]|nr:PKD domain-containing protein [bacterium]
MVISSELSGQGNKLSIQITPPKNISICGLNDTATIQVYNISVGTISGIAVTLNLPPGTFYIKGTVNGTGIAESNISNLNQPVFSAPNLSIASNFYFRVSLTTACGLYNYISGNNSPTINSRIDYSGNYDVGSSLPFSAKVPSILISSITNQSYTGNVGDVFARNITIGNYGKGPLRSLTLRRINGKDLKTFAVNKGTNKFSGDTITTVFGTADFKKIGNLDTFLDQNETIVLTDTSRVIACKYLTTNYELYWGCQGSSCQIVKNSGIVLMSALSPNIVTLPTPAYPVCYYNQINNQLLRITNNGQKPAFNTRVAIDQGYFYNLSSLDTNGLQIKKGWKGTWTKPIIDSFGLNYASGVHVCLGSNPIGSFRIKLGTINPKDTFYISFKNFTCQPTSCNNFYYTNSWMYSTEYYDQCNNKQYIPMVWAKYYDYTGAVASAFTPTDLVDKQKGEFRHLFTYFYTLNLDATAAYEFSLILPKGLSHSLNKNEFYFNNANLTSTWKPDSMRMSGDTVTGYFSKKPFDLANAELIYYLTADCSVAGSNGNKNIQLNIRYLTSKSCTSKEWINLYCYTMSIKIHCINSCAQGMKFNYFSVQRTSYGAPDNNNDGAADGTGKIDLLKIREERAMVGDTIEAYYIGKVLRPKGTAVSWKYLYVESNIVYGSLLDVVSADVVVYRSGTKKIMSCNTVKYKKTVTGVNALFKFDLSVDSVAHCVASGFDYKNTDSVRLLVKYKLTNNIGLYSYTTQFANSFYTSDISKPTQAKNKFQCDTFSGQLILTGYQFLNCCPDNYVINSCSPINISQSFYLGIGSNSAYAGNNYFPFEYRNFARLKEIVMDLPAGFKLNSLQLGQYRTTGSNAYVLETKDSVKWVYKNGKYSFETSKYYKDSAKGKFGLSDDAFQGYLYANITPSCELPPGVYQPIKYDFIFEKRGTLGSGYDTVNSATSPNYYGNDQIIYNKPNYSIKPSIPVNYASKDTAEWEINYTNSSATFSSVNSWFSPDNSGSIKIIDIRDVGPDTSLKKVNDIYKAGIVPFGVSRKFKVKAIYNSCKKDSVILYSGWNCTDYPKDLNTYTCSPEKTVLYLEPQNTQFQVSISDSITTADLCAQSPYYYLLENIGATNAYNTKAQLTLPVGMQVVSGKSYVKHPSNGTWAALPAPKLASGTTYEWDLSTLVSSLAQGFKGITDITRNKIEIKFYVKTDCYYSSGNYIRAGAAANIKCGDKVLVFPAISNPLNITGVTKPYYSLLKVSADTIFPCEKASKVRVKIINLGPSKTGIEDKYQAILLSGMNYDSTLYTAIRNAPNNSLTKTRNINGATEVEFSLNSGISPGDSIEFEMGYTSDNRLLSCGTADFYSQAAVKQEVICVADNSKCKINVVTGNLLLRIPVVKGELSVSNIKTSLQSMSADSETLNVSYVLKNIGQNIVASKTTKLAFYYDKNNSGTVDPGDFLVKNYSINNAIKKGATLSINSNITIKAGYSCALFMVIDSSSCSCSFNQYRLPIPGLQNAGNDLSFCSKAPNSLGITKVNGFTYTWQPAIDLNNDTLAQPSIVFENIGNAKVTKRFILTTKRLTCSSRDTVFATIYQLPKIKLIQKDTMVCRGQKVTLKAVASNGTGLIKTIWYPKLQVVDSTKATTVSTTINTTRYKITISDSFICKANDSLLITTKPYPKSNFTYQSVCFGDTVWLKDSSTIAQDSILSNRWTKGSTDTLNTKSWFVLVPASLTTSVKLVSESPFKCKDTIVKTVTVKPIPKANFTLKNICLYDSASFINTSSIASGTITNYDWQFGDLKTGSGKDLKHKYSQADTWNVKLQIRSSFNCTDTITKSITVNNIPIANFGVTDVCYGDSSKFVNLSSITNDSIVNYDWTFGNGVISDSLHPIIKYTNALTYTVSLKVNSAFGCKDSVTKTTTVNPLPLPKILTDTVCEGQVNTFTEKTSIAKGSIASRLWRISDGATSTNANFSHQFSMGDTFYVQYKAVSNKGCIDSTTGFAMAHPRLKPNIQQTNNCLGDTSYFRDLSTGINTTIATWKWNLGLVDSSSIQHPQLVFTAPGTYNIRLKISSSDGCVYDTFGSQTIYPLPVMGIANTNICRDNQFDFQANNNIMSGTIDSLLWNFDDGTFSNQAIIKHVFPKAGAYNVKIIGISNFGCKDSVTQLINSYPPVIVAFKSDSLCAGIPTQFTDLCNAPNATITQYNWDMGDNRTESIANPLHLYSQAGLYKVNLEITTSYNCSYDTFGYTRIYPVPTSIFRTNPNEVLITNPVIQFRDSSIGADSIRYYMGDGNYRSSPLFKYNYPDSGVFRVKHWATNRFGCIDSSEKDIVVQFTLTFYLPTAFTPNDNDINETLKPDGIGIAKYEMNVFNRWGELIYKTQDSKPWDGKYQNEFVQDGIYTVVYKVYDYKGFIYHYKNLVTLIR